MPTIASTTPMRSPAAVERVALLDMGFEIAEMAAGFELLRAAGRAKPARAKAGAQRGSVVAAFRPVDLVLAERADERPAAEIAAVMALPRRPTRRPRCRARRRPGRRQRRGRVRARRSPPRRRRASRHRAGFRCASRPAGAAAPAGCGRSRCRCRRSPSRDRPRATGTPANGARRRRPANRSGGGRRSCNNRIRRAASNRRRRALHRFPAYLSRPQSWRSRRD